MKGFFWGFGSGEATIADMAGLDPAIHVLGLSGRKSWMPGSSPGMTTEVRPRLRRHAELGFQGRNAGLQRLVFLAREAGHVLDRVELLALDEIEVAQDALSLVADHGIDLALDA